MDWGAIFDSCTFSFWPSFPAWPWLWLSMPSCCPIFLISRGGSLFGGPQARESPLRGNQWNQRLKLPMPCRTCALEDLPGSWLVLDGFTSGSRSSGDRRNLDGLQAESPFVIRIWNLLFEGHRRGTLRCWLGGDVLNVATFRVLSHNRYIFW